jgi:hypothetical protein
LTDPFGTAELRAVVLAAWAASPTRFREDANAEDDLVRGAYRDRLVVELAQNAADAAEAGGAPGRLHLCLTDDALVASNTGAPLSRAGVGSLASLRASAKSESGVGRFGVGFAAVLAVTDEPRVLSTSGGVAFSASATRGAVVGLESMEGELAARGGHVPVLRLPFPTADRPDDGFVTTVVLPLRDRAAGDVARQALADVDASLLLTLPWLHEVMLETDGQRRTVSRGEDTPDGSARVVSIVEETGDTVHTSTWRMTSGSGAVTEDLLDGLPVEEARRRTWWWNWAVPVTHDGTPASLPDSVPPVVHAPTPTDERLDLPALLLASFPLDASRRAVLAGPLSDRLVEEVAAGYLDVVTELAATCRADVLPLVPGPVGVGPLDGRIRSAVRQALPLQPIVSAVDDPARTAVPGSQLRALDVADEALVGLIGDAYAGLVAAPWLNDRRALEVLGVNQVALSDVLDEIAGVRRPPAWWRDVYQELDRLLNGGQITRAALDGLPVPLVGGQTVRGPRGAVAAAGAMRPDQLRDLGLRVIEPDAFHPFLERLGAVMADAAAVLDEPAVRAAVVDSGAADDPEPLARAVLGLLALTPELALTRPWLRRLALTDDHGEWVPAADLLLPDAPLTAEVDPEALGVVDPRWISEFGADLLRSVGVVGDFAVVTGFDLTLDADVIDSELDDGSGDPVLEVAGFADWVDALRDRADVSDEAPPTAPEVQVVSDLDLVREDAWERVVGRLCVGELRDAITAPTRVIDAQGRSVWVASYSAWWLAGAPLIQGRAPTHYRVADADDRLRGLYLDAPPIADVEFLAAVGVRTSVEALLQQPNGAGELLETLVHDEAIPTGHGVAQLYTALSRWAGETTPQMWPPPPSLLRIVTDDATSVVARDDCVLVRAPHHLPLTTSPVIVGEPVLADLLGIAAFEPPGLIAGHGDARSVPEAVTSLLGLEELTYQEHDDLQVDATSLDWWVTSDGDLHAATVDGLARALAWYAGQWSRRWQIAAVLSDPGLQNPGGEDAFDDE